MGHSSPLEQPLECAVWGLAVAEGGTVCTGKKTCAGALCGSYKLLANVFPLVVHCKVTEEEVVQHVTSLVKPMLATESPPRSSSP